MGKDKERMVVGVEEDCSKFNDIDLRTIIEVCSTGKTYEETTGL